MNEDIKVWDIRSNNGNSFKSHYRYSHTYINFE